MEAPLGIIDRIDSNNVKRGEGEGDVRFERVLGTGCTFDEYLISMYSYSFAAINRRKGWKTFPIFTLLLKCYG